jgi:E3 ubiquitin-protein ligase makorin
MHHICKFYVAGYCRNGEKCNWKHANLESTPSPEQVIETIVPAASVEPVVPRIEPSSNILCRYYLQGSCIREDCQFLHNEKFKGVSVPMGARCTYYNQGNCLRGDSCRFLHVNAPETKEELECGICYSACGINKKKFGLLSECDHIFCLDCIRTWRENKSSSRDQTHMCPVCRVKSFYVIPSEIFVTGDRKKEIAEVYKKRLKKIPCKYFQYGERECPFYDQCFYGHFNKDGTPAPVVPKPPNVTRRRYRISPDPLAIQAAALLSRLWEIDLSDSGNSYDEDFNLSDDIDLDYNFIFGHLLDDEDNVDWYESSF